MRVRVVEVPVTRRARLGRLKVSVLAGCRLLFTTLRYSWRR
jgi:hypothetical protein